MTNTQDWEKRITKFGKSLDGRWIYLLKEEGEEEDTWRFLDEHIDSVAETAREEGRKEVKIEHCDKPDCLECNLAAFEAGRQAERERILRIMKRKNWQNDLHTILVGRNKKE